MSKDTGGPAFAYVESEPMTGQVYLAGGMTLRDWFAGQAIGSIIAVMGKGDGHIAVAAAYEIADGLIAERSKP